MKENWTEKHRDVARKIFLEGGWTQKRLFDVGWSETSQCQAIPLPRMVRSQMGDSTSFQKVGAKSKNLKEGVEVAKEVLLNILSVEVSGTGFTSV